MATNTHNDGNKIDAGFYIRARKQTRSWPWPWGKKKSTDISEAEMERPWAGVAEWLRVAHSLLDDKAVEMTRNPDR
jgi:hypothetical protein